MEAYFAIDSLSAEFSTELASIFQAAHAIDSRQSLYALIDGAFEYARPRRKHVKWREGAVNLYASTALESLGDAAPFLLPVSNERQEQRKTLRSLQSNCTDMPMLSFIISTQTVTTLASSLHRFIQVEIDGLQQFVLRFADTRILPELDALMTSECQPGWRVGITEWIMPDRAGRLTRLPQYTPQGESTDNRPKMLLGSQTFLDRLVDAGFADAVLDAIFDQNKDLLLSNMPSVGYRTVHDLHTIAAEYRIDNFPDIVIFCTTGLATSKTFHCHPAFNSILKNRQWRTNQLGTAFAALNDQAWLEIEPENIQ